MTFFEAAVEVLREAGRPLHFKKIAQQAVARDLLSHVGKSPEDTMSARLSQEAAKSADASVIEEVRPNVFGLRAGVDVDDASETILLREPAADEPEPAPVEQDAEVDDDLSPVAAPSVVRVDSDNRRRGRKRSRRGGRRSDETSTDEDRPNQAEASDESDDDGDAPKPSRNDRSRSRGGRSRNKVETPERTESLGNDDLGDVAAAAVGVLERAKGRAYSASKVSNELAKAKVGALSALGTAALRSTLTAVNERRAHQGRPPVFEETKPNFWALATASGTSLARSYAALEHWQVGHRRTLADSLVQSLGELDDTALGSLFTLLLDRLGYTDLQQHEDAPVTLSARSPSALAPATLAVQIFAGSQTVRPENVAALRGSLHKYGATSGVCFALGGVDDATQEELDVPNVAPIALLDGPAIADLLIESGVGVARFSVDVSCLDDALFRQLKKA